MPTRISLPGTSTRPHSASNVKTRMHDIVVAQNSNTLNEAGGWLKDWRVRWCRGIGFVVGLNWIFGSVSRVALARRFWNQIGMVRCRTPSWRAKPRRTNNVGLGSCWNKASNKLTSRLDNLLRSIFREVSQWVSSDVMGKRFKSF